MNPDDPGVSLVRPLALLLLIVIAAVASFIWGWEVQRKQTGPYRNVYSFLKWVNQESPYAVWKDEWRNPDNKVPGLWASDMEVESERGLSADETAELQALGYLGATETATSAIGVTLNEAGAQTGLNLYNSGHAPEAVLMNMAGKVVHRWSFAFADAFPDARPPAKHRGMNQWRRVHLLPNGDLLAIFEGLGIIRVDRESRLLWARYNGAHHDLYVDESGNIGVLTSTFRVHSRMHPWKDVLEDSITVLSPEGEELRSFSLIDAVLDSPFAPLMDLAAVSGDIFHTNTLEPLDDRFEHLSPEFRRGNVLISMRELNFMGIVDLEKESLVWALPPISTAQHDPQLVADGKILLVDNDWRRGEYSRVVEFDPLGLDVSWSYEGDASNGFYTSCCGTAQRLPNGNTLITETDGGRAFEVTPDDEIVWEFFNPGRGGTEGELVGRLYEVLRIDPGSLEDWARSPGPG